MKKYLLSSVIVLLLLVSVSLTLVPKNIAAVAQTTDPAKADVTPTPNYVSYSHVKCFSDSGSWPVGNYRQTADWFTGFMFSDPQGTTVQPIPPTIYTYFQDLNGDGLTDYLYMEKSRPIGDQASGYVRYERSCVLLNNGHGWDRAYKCEAYSGSSARGDCATTS